MEEMNNITYKDLERVNSEINTTPIKGKDYAEVPERIKAFRKLHPNGSVTTEIYSIENGICIMKATVKDEFGKVLGTGTAYEKENSTFINKTSYIENCETSAVGRALGMAGFGIDTSVASAEEVINAINNQNQFNTTNTTNTTNINVDKKNKSTTIKMIPCTDEQIKEAIELGVDLGGMISYFKVKDIKDISKEQFEKILERKRK